MCTVTVGNCCQSWHLQGADKMSKTRQRTVNLQDRVEAENHATLQGEQRE